MSLISEFRATEETIKELQERLKTLSQDSKLQKELDFEKKLLALMNDYQKSLPDITALLDSGARSTKQNRPVKAVTPTKRVRRIKQYKNPHTGETIETKGGNHKTLKEWKNKWGADTVEEWSSILE
ncbi:histone-like nucleoid-structuring protein MvaT [Azomonas macrocytogenes]|uniref:MvaT DNA-binding domain-containing protein n=1 Tax=Azomonas macrocytogenes TaxID=69962 RepID=A0A839T4R1_AZOMA|nr:histone-like nucleoid-structuring protein MvaT [Azomonas macrocytogenes]MBB3104068.1 hypothetical protein [Azomonas macrocytogenes]